MIHHTFLAGSFRDKLLSTSIGRILDSDPKEHWYVHNIIVRSDDDMTFTLRSSRVRVRISCDGNASKYAFYLPHEDIHAAI